MIARGQLNPSSGFRHVSRPIKGDEKIPAMPSLLEQLQGCCSELVRQAREQAAAAQAELDEADAENCDWETEFEDAA